MKHSVYTMFYKKKELEPNWAYFDNHKLIHTKIAQNTRIIVHWDYEVNIVGFLTVLRQSR